MCLNHCSFFFEVWTRLCSTLEDGLRKTVDYFQNVDATQFVPPTPRLVAVQLGTRGDLSVRHNDDGLEDDTLQSTS